MFIVKISVLKFYKIIKADKFMDGTVDLLRVPRVKFFSAFVLPLVRIFP